MKRREHYQEAERLLNRAKELTQEYVEVNSEATRRKIDLEMLARQITDRAHVHALLAISAESVAAGMAPF